MNGEERLLEIFRALDNRGKAHVLAIAEGELKYAPEAAYFARSGVLNASAGILSTEEGKGREYDETSVRAMEQ